MTRTLRLFLLGLLVCSASTNAEAQWDLFWQHADGRRAVWAMDGTTRRSGDLWVTEPLDDPLADPLWQIGQSGPYFLLFQHQGDGRLAGWAMWCGYPVASYSLSVPQVPNVNWKLRGAGYFNDLFLYLIWQNEMTGQIAAWKMGSDLTTVLDGRLLTPSVPDTNWRIVGVADFNSDGNSDLLWQHQTSGLIGLWYMNGLTRTEGVLLSPGQVPDTDWKIRGVEWVNDDDYHPDLIWQHQTTGHISVWLMRGRQRVAGILLSPDRVADTNWRIVGTAYRSPYECWW